MATSGYKKFGIGLNDSEKRDHIRSAARMVFGKVGYHRATVGLMLTEAGISRRTFYCYFKSKEDVLTDILDGFVKNTSRILELEDPARLNSTDEFREQLIRVAGMLLTIFLENRDCGRVFFEGLVMNDDVLAPRTQSVLQSLTGVIEEYIRRARQKGFTRDVDPKLTSLTLMGIYLEVARQVIIAVEPPSLEKWVPEILALLDRGLIAQS